MIEGQQVRAAMVTRMEAAGALTALIPAASMYGERVPDNRTYPFTKFGPPDLIPQRTSCWNGTQDNVTVHWFMQGLSNDTAIQFGAALRTEFDEQGLVLESGEIVVPTWTGGRVFEDPEEKDTWHGFATFEVV